MMIEGSGSGRPKNMWIRWFRIRNTGQRPTLMLEHKDVIIVYYLFMYRLLNWDTCSSLAAAGVACL
jgi:hypothetical protein